MDKNVTDINERVKRRAPALRVIASRRRAAEEGQRFAISWDDCEDRTPPEREWIIKHWVPHQHITLLAGRGGIGKTLLAQHIGAALALGHRYVDDAEPRKVLMWAGEDDHDELWRRQVAISKWIGQPLGALTERFSLYPYVGDDITLAGPASGSLHRTPRMDELRQQVYDHRAELVILDNVARIYGGSENDRHQVTTFLAWLQAACAPAAILLLAHPAKANGSEYSGSTAWEGAVRSRLYLDDRPPSADDDAPIDDRVRFLARRKANYSPLDIRRLTLTNGVLVPDDIDPARTSQPSNIHVNGIVKQAIIALAKRDMYGNYSPSSPDYLPKLAQKHNLLGIANRKAFTQAMDKMFFDGELVKQPIGKYRNRTTKYGLVLS